MAVFFEKFVFLSLAILFSTHAFSAADEQINGSLACYGSGFSQQIGPGRVRVSLDHDFICSECTGQTLIDSNIPEVSFLLSSDEIHVFQNGTLIQSIPFQDCSPQYLHHSLVNSERLFVHCFSSAPDFLPTFIQIDRETDTENWQIISLRKNNPDYLYANISIVISGLWEENIDDLVVAIVRDRPMVIIHSESTGTYGTYSLETQCDTLTNLHRSKPLGEQQHMQFIVDCLKSGSNKRLVVTLDEFLESVQEPFELLNTQGSITVTPDGSYFLIQDGSQIVYIDRSNPSTLPTIKDFTAHITSTPYLNDQYALVESPGNNRILINQTEFIASTATSGFYILPNSEAYCPNEICPIPTLVKDQLLVVFVQNGAYLDALAYNLESPLSDPLLVGKIQATDFPYVCFFSEGSTPLISPRVDTSGTTDPNRGSTNPFQFTTGSDTPAPDTTAPNTQNNTVIVIIVLVIVAGIVMVVIAGIAVFIFFCTRKQERSKLEIRSYSPEKKHPVELNDYAKPNDNETQTVKEHDKSTMCQVVVEEEDSACVTNSLSSTSSKDSSRVPTPNEEHHLTLPGPTHDQNGYTSDYFTNSSRGSTPCGPTPADSPVPCIRKVCIPVMQQDGTFRSDQTELVTNKKPFAVTRQPESSMTSVQATS